MRPQASTDPQAGEDRLNRSRQPAIPLVDRLRTWTLTFSVSPIVSNPAIPTTCHSPSPQMAIATGMPPERVNLGQTMRSGVSQSWTGVRSGNCLRRCAQCPLAHGSSGRTCVEPDQGPRSGLWSDEPDDVDLLAFSAVATTVIDAVLDETLDPVAVGVSGAWGSGKTTVLKLIESGLKERNLGPEKQILIVSTDPWRYDPSAGAKEALIGEILAAITRKLHEVNTETGSRATLELAKKLTKRVQWSKAIRLTARAGITMQLPKLDDVLDLVAEPSDNGPGAPRGLEQFRGEFEALMESPGLAGVERVVVLVDDLDRCLPDTVVETLEAIRLFLAVPKMAFVIAADEDRVADAIRDRFPAPGRTPDPTEEFLPEEPASLYLHKIVQTTVPIPALSRFDTEAYLILLQLLHVTEREELRSYTRHCDDQRRVGGVLDDLGAVITGRAITEQMAFAARLTPILYEKLRGNPRRIKRFLNDLRVRQTVAVHRGITLDEDVVAKLMVLEKLIKDGFTHVLDWLAKGDLREQIRTLEKAAGRTVRRPAPETGAAQEASAKPEPVGKGRGIPKSAPDVPAAAQFSDDLLRWAKLPPALADDDLAPYLYLAASFTGKLLLDTGLPSRLRDLAANLVSHSRAEQKSVTDADLDALGLADATLLIEYFGRVGRDQPSNQPAAFAAIVRLVPRYQQAADAANRALQTVPADDLTVPAIMRFQNDALTFAPVLQRWYDSTTDTPVRNALGLVLGTGR
ncbi:P-loop NTPase fold protein [Micromonospora sp. NPDC047187]|uniref:KAP family P-loop NTPase fold protein n=1 Tax=Micromonospora sp. NPDC047187 TaxID=3155262 RepID=UPI0033CAA590